MPYTTIIPSFAGGEWSPALAGRVDLEKYSIACKSLTNTIVHSHGGVSNAPGWEYIASAKSPSKKARIIPFTFSNIQSYVIEFGDNYCRFYMNGGLIEDLENPGTPYEIESPYGENDLELIKFTQSADVLYLTHPNYAPRTLIRYGHADWEMNLFDYKKGPFMPINIEDNQKITPSGTTGTINLTSDFDIFDEKHVGALLQINHYMQSQSSSGNITSVGSSTGFLNLSKHFSASGVSETIYCFSDWTISITGSTQITNSEGQITQYAWSGTIKLQKSVDDGNTWTDVASYTGNVSTSGTVSNPCLLRLIRLTTLKQQMILQKQVL